PGVPLCWVSNALCGEACIHGRLEDGPPLFHRLGLERLHGLDARRLTARIPQIFLSDPGADIRIPAHVPSCRRRLEPHRLRLDALGPIPNLVTRCLEP